MSIKRRMERLDAALVGGSAALKITAQYAAMTDRELLNEAERLTRQVRSGQVPKDDLGPRSPLFAHLSDEQLLAEAEEGRRQIRERDARLRGQV